MSGWKLTLKQAPRLRVDLRSLSPAALAGLSAGAVAKLGHGDGYAYPHDAAEGWVPQQYRPDDIDKSAERYWRPTGRGGDVDRRRDELESGER